MMVKLSIILLRILKKMSGNLPPTKFQWQILIEKLKLKIYLEESATTINPLLENPKWLSELTEDDQCKLCTATYLFVEDATNENQRGLDEVFQRIILSQMSMDSSGSGGQQVALLITRPVTNVVHKNQCNAQVQRLTNANQRLKERNDKISHKMENLRLKLSVIRRGDSRPGRIVHKQSETILELRRENKELKEKIVRLTEEKSSCNLGIPRMRNGGSGSCAEVLVRDRKEKNRELEQKEAGLAETQFKSTRVVVQTNNYPKATHMSQAMTADSAELAEAAFQIEEAAYLALQKIGE